MSTVPLMFEPDAAQMRRHLEHLFGGWLDGCHEGRIELAWTDPGDRRLRHAKSFGTDELDGLVELAVLVNRAKGQNVYIGQALRKPDSSSTERGKDDDFFALTAFYVDIDENVTATATDTYRARGCPPTGVVITGRHPHMRAHMLWRLESPVRDDAACREQNMALAHALGGDPKVVNPGRVLRLGGSIAWPTKDGRITEITEFLEFDDGRATTYFPEQIARAFPPEQAASSANMRVPPARSGVSTLRIGISTVSVETCMAAIRDGDHWHDNMLLLVGHWIGRGWSDTEILTATEPLTLLGYTVGATRRDVAGMIAGGRRKWNKPNPEPEISAAVEDPALEPGFLDHLNLALLPQRRWILGRSLLRGHLSLLVAPAGVGKSTHGIARAVAIATGRDLTNEPVHEPVKAWIYNTEDDLDELKRRLGAVLQHGCVPFPEISGRIALNCGSDRPLLFAKLDRHDQVIPQPDVGACIAAIRKHDIGLFVVDPFVETHEVNENSNEQIKTVAALFREIARAANCAVLLVHHTAKPPQGVSDGHAGNMNTARGASALVGVARVVQTLFSMSRTDAEQLGVEEEDRHLYLRLDDAKANLSLMSGSATWYRRESITIANGDEVGVLVSHDFLPAAVRPDITPNQTRQIFEEVERRWAQAEPFSASGNSHRCIVTYLIQQGLKKSVARRVLAAWLINQMLRSEIFNSKSKAKGLRVVKWPG
jgi:hypothetical protein